MIEVKTFFNTLQQAGISFYTGVPDSLLKDLCGYITDNTTSTDHIIAVNEGAAVGLAAGYHLSTGSIPVVYMQNSGIGNAINPLLSLADDKVYKIPMLLVVGWRGEPGVKDEPQHIKQGEVTLALFDAMQIPYVIIDADKDNAIEQVKYAINQCRRNSIPFALIIRGGIFGKYSLKSKAVNHHQISREDAMKVIIDTLNQDDIVVSTTGKLSRELFEYREVLGQGHNNDFLTVGSMGHSSSIAFGIALNASHRTVYCFDGDGAFLMHMGSAATTGYFSLPNLKHILFNNGAHESVGAQPTIGFSLDIEKIVKGCGYKNYYLAENTEQIVERMKQMKQDTEPSLLEIRVNLNSRNDLGRPTVSPLENKNNLMKNIRTE